MQDYKEVIIPGMLARGKIDQKGQRFCEETLNLPLDSAKVVAALKKLLPKRIVDKSGKNIVKLMESVPNYSYFCQKG